MLLGSDWLTYAYICIVIGWTSRIRFSKNPVRPLSYISKVLEYSLNKYYLHIPTNFYVVYFFRLYQIDHLTGLSIDESVHVSLDLGIGACTVIMNVG